ncbi:MAG: NADH-quinone oxidoreductase subunit F [Nanoarchaeota archaeon]|nr:NADH-quinone oxidoreductase subunit F [Nanoarchaeota archaeon]
MQILRKTGLKGLEKARKIGPESVMKLLIGRELLGRGGAAFPTGKKWQFASGTEADEKYIICNADEGEPGTFKDKFIINKNPETLVEGIIIAAETIGAKQAFIYLRGEYVYLKSKLAKVINELTKKARTKVKIDIILGAGAYVCGDETAIIQSIMGYRGSPYYKPPFPPVEGLWGKPTVINNVETLTNVPQAILFKDWDKDLRLYSLSGNVTKPGIYELPVGASLAKLIKQGEPENDIKTVYFGCFGGCMPYKNIKLTADNVCGMHCVIGAFTIIVVDERHSMVDMAETIAKFYEHESCGKCTPCREGTKRILDLIRKIRAGKAKSEDINTLLDLAEHIHDTSLCGLGQTATNHVLTALRYFRKEFQEKIR